MTQNTQAIIDSHCHLDNLKFDVDRDAVIQRAKQNNVVAIVNIGVDVETNGRSVALAAQHPGYIFHTVGAHPADVDRFDTLAIKAITEQATQSQPQAVGEIGLDYHHDSDKAKQWRVFESMLETARHLALPVVIHNRNADQDMLSMLTEHADLKLLLHSYLSGPDYVEKFLQLGCFFGIGGPLTFTGKSAQSHREAVKIIPLQRLLLETDAPYLTPHPHRGQRNEPAYTVLTASKIAEQKGLDLAQIAAVSCQNSIEFFGLPVSLSQHTD